MNKESKIRKILKLQIQHFKFKYNRSIRRPAIEVTEVVKIWNISHQIEVNRPPGGKMDNLQGFLVDMETVN